MYTLAEHLLQKRFDFLLFLVSRARTSSLTFAIANEKMDREHLRSESVQQSRFFLFCYRADTATGMDLMNKEHERSIFLSLSLF